MVAVGVAVAAVAAGTGAWLFAHLRGWQSSGDVITSVAIAMASVLALAQVVIALAQLRAAAAPKPMSRPAGLDSRRVQGQQVGNHNTQHNHHYASTPVIRPDQVVGGLGIPAQPPNFQPRAELMAKLVAAVDGHTVTVVCPLTGQRGVGKTQLAAAYARDRHKQGWLVIWVNAERPDTIAAGLTRAADDLELRLEGENAADGIARLLSRLRARGEDKPALMVFDDVTNPDHITEYLPGAGPTQVVVTSTQLAVRNLGERVPVEVYTRAEAVAFLGEATGLDDPAGAAELAEELGWLPLALTHAAAVIYSRGIGYTDCVALIRNYPLPRYLVRQVGQHYPRGTAAAILLSLREAGVDADPELARLAGVVALLSPDGVPRALLTGLAEDGDAAALDDHIARLADGSIITHTTGSTKGRGAVVMHRLVARVICERNRDNATERGLMGAAVGLLAKAVFPEASAWQRRQDGEQLISQIDALWGHSNLAAGGPSAPSPDELLEALVSLRNWSACQLTGAVTLERAISYAHSVHTECGRLLGAEHPHTLAAAHNLADAYQAAGRLGEAIPLYKQTRQTLDKRRQVLGAEHLDSLTSANNLTVAYQAAGRLDEAIPLFKQTLDKRRQVLGAEHTNTLTSANDLAYAYASAGKLDEAIPLYKQTLDKRRQVLGAEHPDSLTSANNLTLAYQAAGRLDETIALFKQTLTDCKRLLSDEHPFTLISANNLAGAYQAAGRLDEVIALFKQTLTDCKRLLGHEHPNTLTSANNLAGAYQAAGRLDEVIPLFKQTLDKRCQVLGAEHPDSLTSANDLACAYASAGKLDEAIPLFKQTLTDCKRLLGDDHPLSQTVAENLQWVTALATKPGRRRWWSRRFT